MSPGSKSSSKVRTLHIGESASQPLTAGSNREPKRGRVLVVDDERSIADSLAFMLAHEKYETKTAYSGTEAVEAAKEFRPNILITDLVMPDMSGTEAAIQICKILPEIKVIVFSGKVTGDELKVRAESAGCVMAIIEKPLHPQELLSKIRILIAR